MKCVIFAIHCSRTNIESYGRRLLVRTLSGVLHTSSVVTGIWRYIATIHNSLSHLMSSWHYNSK